MTKPFDMAELIARIKSLLSRRSFAGGDSVTYGDISINTNSRLITIKSSIIEFTRSEYEILLYFFSDPNGVLSKEIIAENIWGDTMDLADSFGFIYSHVRNIRKKNSI